MIRRSPIRKVSAKQAKRTALLSKLKREWIAEQFRLYGFVTCQGTCGREIHDERDARLLLDGHHRIKKQDTPESLLYVCRTCHRFIHLGNGV